MTLACVSAHVAVAQHSSSPERGEAARLAVITVDALPESDVDKLHRMIDAYYAAMVIGSYDEADSLAKRIIEQSIRLYGLDSHETAKAISDLGQVQLDVNDYESAILNFTASINIVERIENRLSRALSAPLRGLAEAQLKAERLEFARAALERAIHVTHVNDGPHNTTQIDDLENLAEVYLLADDEKKATKLHEHIFNIESHNNALNSEGIIPALERQGKWLHRMGRYQEERVNWQKIVQIIDTRRGKNDLSLIAPLTALGTSYLYQPVFYARNYIRDGAMQNGETYLRRAIRVAEQNTDANWRTRFRARLALADYYTLSLRETWANRMYREIWTILTNDDERLAVRSALFDQPTLLQTIHPPKYLESLRMKDEQEPSGDYELGTIVLSFDISHRGFAKDIKIVEVDPSGLDDMEFRMTREVRKLIYRPRMEDGLTVATPNQSYVHEFYYRISDLQQGGKSTASIKHSDDECLSAPGC